MSGPPPLPPRRKTLPKRSAPTRLPAGESKHKWNEREILEEVWRDAEWSVDFNRPKTTADCPTGDYCPFVSCRYHLYLDVSPSTGTITYNYPTKNVWDLECCCILKAIEKLESEEKRTEFTLEEVGEKLGLTRERVRQLEVDALSKLKEKTQKNDRWQGLLDHRER